MRRFVMRKLALFDWIDQLNEHDRVVAYRIYTLTDRIRLSKKLPFVISLPLFFVPLFFHHALFVSGSGTPAPLALFSLSLASYVTGTLILSFLLFKFVRTKWMRELQHIFFAHDAHRVLNQLLSLDVELASETHMFLRPPKESSHRRARHHPA